jgi:hypothetical protein
MNIISYYLLTIYCSCIFNFLFAQPALAYLDPGTGSYIFQLLTAALLGGLFFIKPFFLKLKFFFKKIFLREKNE